MPKQNITPLQLEFLNRLNNFLHKKEKEILNKAAFYRSFYEAEISKNEFTNDFEIDIEVVYYKVIVDDEIELHKYVLGFELLYDAEDWYEGGSIFPKLENGYCYLMHDLCYHSKLSIEQVCSIGTVWIDLHVRDQSIIDKGVEGF
jgi:hypothetical protein